MKKLYNILICSVALTIAFGVYSCKDANEYKDARTDNPSWVTNYNDSMTIPHPVTIANTKWLRGSGLKINVQGKEVQGFVESLDFFSADSVVVKMSQGVTEGTWTDDSNTEAIPSYEYTYSEITGKVEIMKMVKDDKGKVSKVVIFTGVAVEGSPTVLTMTHYGDIPVQTYLIRQ